jgi:hypothetical protein
MSYCAAAAAAAVYSNHVQKEQVETAACKRDNYATTLQQPKGEKLEGTRQDNRVYPSHLKGQTVNSIISLIATF